MLYDSAPAALGPSSNEINPATWGLQNGACAKGQSRWQVSTEAVELPGRFAKVQLRNPATWASSMALANISVVATLIGAG